MKLRRTLCAVMVWAMALCCVGVGAQAAGQETVSPYATRRFSFDVEANTMLKANTSFPLEYGETVRINASYSPSVSVDFGLIDEDGIFHSLNVTTGSIDKTILITKRGNYTFAVRNNASVVISVTGFVTY